MSRNPSVAVFGTFDGLHKGHRAVLNAALSFKQYEPVAIIFDEPPKRQATGVFVPMLMPSERKKDIMRELGFKTIEVLDYNEIHDMPPESFLDVMFRKFNIKVAVCGFNYRFGKGAEGDAEFLTSYCHTHGSEAVVCPGTNFSGQIISSTLIRNLIADGKVSFANTLLGSEFSYCSEVIHGDGRGKTLGIPTINQPLDENLVVPKFGVYASKVQIGGIYYAAVTNIGIRPTFLLKKPLSETYIVDFDGDLYGERLEIKLLEYIREEIRFDSVEALKDAINSDAEKAKKIFSGEAVL